MDLQNIRYFLGLAKELHFWNTAEKMFVTQSALSRRIKSLEDEIGVQLFERDKRNVKLTAARCVFANRMDADARRNRMRSPTRKANWRG